MLLTELSEHSSFLNQVRKCFRINKEIGLSSESTRRLEHLQIVVHLKTLQPLSLGKGLIPSGIEAWATLVVAEHFVNNLFESPIR